MSDTPIADAIESEAATATRPGSYERLMSLARFVARMEGDRRSRDERIIRAAMAWLDVSDPNDSAMRALIEGDGGTEAVDYIIAAADA